MFTESFQVIAFSIFSILDFNPASFDSQPARFVFYSGPNFNDHQVYNLYDLPSVLKNPKFTFNKTDIYMHGYKGSQDSYSVQVVVNAYLKANVRNLITIDWEHQVSGSYLSAQKNLLKLAPVVADALLNLTEAGLNEESLSLVGHSLGGHGVGIISREVYKKSLGRVLLPRVTALDPSNPKIHGEFILDPIVKTDARFVDVIHTDAGSRGTALPSGDADFWPNEGRAVQRGCPIQAVNFLCSHLKAYAYWAESVDKANDRQLFLAERTDSIEGPRSPDVVQMGFNCPTSARGNYSLTVNSNYAAVPIIGLKI